MGKFWENANFETDQHHGFHALNWPTCAVWPYTFDGVGDATWCYCCGLAGHIVKQLASFAQIWNPVNLNSVLSNSVQVRIRKGIELLRSGACSTFVWFQCFWRKWNRTCFFRKILTTLLQSKWSQDLVHFSTKLTWCLVWPGIWQFEQWQRFWLFRGYRGYSQFYRRLYRATILYLDQLHWFWKWYQRCPKNRRARPFGTPSALPQTGGRWEKDRTNELPFLKFT